MIKANFAGIQVDIHKNIEEFLCTRMTSISRKKLNIGYNRTYDVTKPIWDEILEK